VELVPKITQARDVAPRLCQAGDEASFHRIKGPCHYYRDRPRGVLGRPTRGGSWSHNHVHLALDQLRRQVTEPLFAPRHIADLHDEVLALNIAEVV
jgi:hypothetical protein